MDLVVAGLSVEHRGCPLSEIVALQFPVITPLPLFQQPVAIQSQLPHLPSSPSSLTVSLGGSQPKCCLSEALSPFQRELTVQIGSSPMQTQVAAQLCALQTTSYSPCSRAAWARLLEIQQVDASATCESLHYDFGVHWSDPLLDATASQNLASGFRTARTWSLLLVVTSQLGHIHHLSNLLLVVPWLHVASIHSQPFLADIVFSFEPLTCADAATSLPNILLPHLQPSTVATAISWRWIPAASIHLSECPWEPASCCIFFRLSFFVSPLHEREPNGELAERAP